MSSDNQQPDDDGAKREGGDLAPIQQPGAGSGPEQGPTSSPRRSGPKKDEILEKLDHLAGLIMMDYVTPAKGNAVRNVYATALSHLDASNTNATLIADQDVLTTMRNSPELLKLLSPFLTQSQLEMIAREAGNE